MIDRLRTTLIFIGLIAGAVTFVACEESDNRVVITPSEAAFVPVIESSDVYVDLPRLVLTLLEQDAQPAFAKGASYRIRYFEPTEGGIKFHSAAELQIIDVEGFRYLVANHVPFRTPGVWAVAVTVELPDGRAESSPRLPLQVHEQSRAPSTGDRAPRVDTPTLSTGMLESLEEGGVPDSVLRLYEHSALDLINQGEPFLIVWSTPDRCAGRLACAAALEQARLIAEQNDIAVIHVSPFDRPRRPTLQALIDAANEAWSIQAEPQFYIVDSAGIVAARFEIVVEQSDLEAAIEEALR